MWLKRFTKLSYRTSMMLGTLAGMALCSLVLIMSYEVVMRYFVNRPTIWVFEVSHYVFAAVMTWGLAYGLAIGAHIRIDVVIRRLPYRGQRWLGAITSVFTLGVAGLLLWTMVSLSMRSLKLGHTSPTLLSIPQGFVQIVPIVGFVLFTVMAVVQCLGAWQNHSSGRTRVS